MRTARKRSARAQREASDAVSRAARDLTAQPAGDRDYLEAIAENVRMIGLGYAREHRVESWG